MTTHPTQPKARRFVELFLVPFAGLMALRLPVMLWQDRLPDPVASHWGPGGVADGSMSVGTALTGMSIVWIVLWLLLLGILQSRRIGGREAQGVVATMYWAWAVLVGIWVLGLAANLDAATWQDADNLGGLAILSSMVGALPIAGLGWWLAAGRPEAGAPKGTQAVPVTAPEGQVAIWVGQATNRVLIGFTIALAVAFAVLRAVTSEGGPGLVISVTLPLVLLLLAARVRVSVGPSGVRISMGWLGWPSRTVTYDQMTSIEVEDVVPMEYGGWGFRLANGAQAHVIRSGEAIRINREGKSDILVTVDDAGTGAAILAGHLVGRPNL